MLATSNFSFSHNVFQSYRAGVPITEEHLNPNDILDTSQYFQNALYYSWDVISVTSDSDLFRPCHFGSCQALPTQCSTKSLKSTRKGE